MRSVYPGASVKCWYFLFGSWDICQGSLQSVLYCIRGFKESPDCICLCICTHTTNLFFTDFRFPFSFLFDCLLHGHDGPHNHSQNANRRERECKADTRQHNTMRRTILLTFTPHRHSFLPVGARVSRHVCLYPRGYLVVPRVVTNTSLCHVSANQLEASGFMTTEYSNISP